MTQPAPAPAGHVLDATALAGIATGESVFLQTVVAVAARRGDTLLVPATVLAEVARTAGPAGRGELEWSTTRGAYLIAELTARDAIALGATLDKAGPATARRLGLVGAHVALHAQTRNWPIVTRTPGVYGGLDVAVNDAG